MTDTELEEIIARGESRSIEFKRPEVFAGDFRCKLAITIAALSNTKGGGTIIIGLDNITRVPVEMSTEQIDSFDRTKVFDFLSARLSPTPEFQISLKTFKGKQILLLSISEISSEIVIVSRDIAGKKKYATEGDIFIRTDGAQTQRAASMIEMRELLNLALSKREHAILQSIQDIITGIQPLRQPSHHLIHEFVLLPGYSQQIESAYPRHMTTTALLVPQTKLLKKLSPPEQHALISRAASRRPYRRFPEMTRLKMQNRSDSIILEGISENFPQVVEIMRAGSIGSIDIPWCEYMPKSTSYPYEPPPNRHIPFHELILHVFEIFEYFRNYVELAEIPEFSMSLTIRQILNRRLNSLNAYYTISDSYQASENGFEFKRNYFRSQYVSSWEIEAGHACTEIFAIFQWFDMTPETIRNLWRTYSF